MTTIHPLVAHVLSQVLDVDETELSPTLALEALPEWDSVNALRVLVLLEREVGAAINFEQFVAASTVGALGELVTAIAGVAVPTPAAGRQS